MNGRLYLYAGSDLGISASAQPAKPPGWSKPVGYISLYEVGDANGGVTIYLSAGQMLALSTTIDSALRSQSRVTAPRGLPRLLRRVFG